MFVFNLMGHNDYGSFKKILTQKYQFLKISDDK
jgi:hypothetical protein